jgi:hypothetical protein
MAFTTYKLWLIYAAVVVAITTRVRKTPPRGSLHCIVVSMPMVI